MTIQVLHAGQTVSLTNRWTATQMRVCAVIVLLGIVLHPAIRAGGQIPYEESYASQLWTEDYYEILRRSNDARIREKPASPWKENAAAESFIKEMGSLQRPDLEAYAAMDVNDNPIAVLWAQFALAREGALDAVSIPDHFHYLLFLSLGFYGNLINKEDDHLISRLTLNAFSRLPMDTFLKRYYDPAYQAAYRDIWQMDVPTHVINLSRYDPDYVREWLRGLLLLEYEISAWYWDRTFATEMIADYAYEAFDEDAIMHRSHSYDDERGEWADMESRKTALEITRDMAFTVLAIIEDHESLVEVFGQLCSDLAHAYWERSVALLEGLAGYAGNPLRDEKWLAEMCRNMELRLNGVLIWGADLRDIKMFRETYEWESMPVRNDVRVQYEELGFTIEEELCEDQVSQLRRLLLREEYCLNYSAIRALIMSEAGLEDETFWREWKEVVGRVRDKHYHFERCIGHLARIGVCRDYGGYTHDLIMLTAKIDYLRWIIDP